MPFLARVTTMTIEISPLPHIWLKIRLVHCLMFKYKPQVKHTLIHFGRWKVYVESFE